MKGSRWWCSGSKQGSTISVMSWVRVKLKFGCRVQVFLANHKLHCSTRKERRLLSLITKTHKSDEINDLDRLRTIVSLRKKKRQWTNHHRKPPITSSLWLSLFSKHFDRQASLDRYNKNTTTQLKFYFELQLCQRNR